MSAIHWPLAARVAGRMAGTDLFEDSYHYARLAGDIPGMVATAARAVEDETGLRWDLEPTVKVVTRREWAEANVAGFSRLLSSVEKKIASKDGAGIGKRVAGRIVAAEVGALVGLLARRVLGQYELVLPADESGSGDTISFVGANILTMERQQQFRPDEFRYWVALHECTHRLQFTGVPWLRPHFLGLVTRLVDSSKPEPGRARRVAEELRAAARAGRPAIGDAGLMGLFATAEQREALDEVQALMALLEGHGHVIMDRIGAREMVTQETMSRVLKMRRSDPRTAAFFRLTGLEMKMKQYELGERFILGVESRAGLGAVDAVWSGPENLPSLSEITDPQRWLERVG